jgi:hypothetical protein
MSLWLAAIRLNATVSDKTARNCQEKVRIRPLPVSVAWRTAAAYPGEPVRLDKLPSSGLARGSASATMRLAEYDGAPIRAALLVWENRCCDPRSPCALCRRTG